MLGTLDAWLTSHLSQETSKSAYYILNCRIFALKIKMWVTFYFFNFWWEKELKKKEIYKSFSVQLFYAVAKKIFKNLMIFFAHKNWKKTTLKSYSEKLKSTLFSLMPWAA